MQGSSGAPGAGLNPFACWPLQAPVFQHPGTVIGPAQAWPGQLGHVGGAGNSSAPGVGPPGTAPPLQVPGFGAGMQKAGTSAPMGLAPALAAMFAAAASSGQTGSQPALPWAQLAGQQQPLRSDAQPATSDRSQGEPSCCGTAVAHPRQQHAFSQQASGLAFPPLPGGLGALMPIQLLSLAQQQQQHQLQQQQQQQSSGGAALGAGFAGGGQAPSMPTPLLGFLPQQLQMLSALQFAGAQLPTGAGNMLSAVPVAPMPAMAAAGPLPVHNAAAPTDSGSRQRMMRDILGKRGFAAIRGIMLRQQATFVQQLFELHKLHSLQKLLWSELQAEMDLPTFSSGAAPGSRAEMAESSGRAPTLPGRSQVGPEVSVATPSAGPAAACVQLPGEVVGPLARQARYAGSASQLAGSPAPTDCELQRADGEGQQEAEEERSPAPRGAPLDPCPSTSLVESQDLQRFQDDIHALLNVPNSLRRQLQRTNSGAVSSGPARSNSAATGPALHELPHMGATSARGAASVSSGGAGTIARPSPGPHALRPVPTRLCAPPPLPLPQQQQQQQQQRAQPGVSAGPEEAGQGQALSRLHRASTDEQPSQKVVRAEAQQREHNQSRHSSPARTRSQPRGMHNTSPPAQPQPTYHSQQQQQQQHTSVSDGDAAAAPVAAVAPAPPAPASGPQTSAGAKPLPSLFMNPPPLLSSSQDPRVELPRPAPQADMHAAWFAKHFARPRQPADAPAPAAVQQEQAPADAQATVRWCHDSATAMGTDAQPGMSGARAMKQVAEQGGEEWQQQEQDMEQHHRRHKPDVADGGAAASPSAARDEGAAPAHSMPLKKRAKYNSSTRVCGQAVDGSVSPGTPPAMRHPSPPHCGNASGQGAAARAGGTAPSTSRYGGTAAREQCGDADGAGGNSPQGLQHRLHKAPGAQGEAGPSNACGASGAGLLPAPAAMAMHNLSSMLRAAEQGAAAGTAAATAMSRQHQQMHMHGGAGAPDADSALPAFMLPPNLGLALGGHVPLHAMQSLAGMPVVEAARMLGQQLFTGHLNGMAAHPLAAANALHQVLASSSGRVDGFKLLMPRKARSNRGSNRLTLNESIGSDNSDTSHDKEGRTAHASQCTAGAHSCMHGGAPSGVTNGRMRSAKRARPEASVNCGDDVTAGSAPVPQGSGPAEQAPPQQQQRGHHPRRDQSCHSIGADSREQSLPAAAAEAGGRVDGVDGGVAGQQHPRGRQAPGAPGRSMHGNGSLVGTPIRTGDLGALAAAEDASGVEAAGASKRARRDPQRLSTAAAGADHAATAAGDAAAARAPTHNLAPLPCPDGGGAALCPGAVPAAAPRGDNSAGAPEKSAAGILLSLSVCSAQDD